MQNEKQKRQGKRKMSDTLWAPKQNKSVLMRNHATYQGTYQGGRASPK